ncbi:MAG TPA: flagellar assembly peptidoglycan hydrolase FlgJ [Lautropia sp.]|nr:flagellar assembly peptidoglycan hydrolase FlgJ [Lautropia sp.]
MSVLSSSAGSFGSATSGLALDARGLETLRQSSETDPEGSVRKAAGQFEALFMTQLLKSMRAAIPKSGMFDGPGSDLYSGMLDSQLTQAMSSTPNGLADIIAKQMTRHMDGLKASHANEQAAAAGGTVPRPPVAMGPISIGKSAPAAATGPLTIGGFAPPAAMGPLTIGKFAPPASMGPLTIGKFALPPSSGPLDVGNTASGPSTGSLAIGKSAPHVVARAGVVEVVAGAGAALNAAGDGQPALAPFGRNELKDAQSLQESLSRRLSPSQAAFVEGMWPHARVAEEKTGLPAAYVVGQAALESGWGKRDIRDADGNPTHNLFGVKATGSWKGRTVAVMTTEYTDGKPRKVVEQFRRYDSYAEAFTDWSELMTRSSRYAGVLRAGNASEFARGLESAGYATDPRYGEKLERTINQTLSHKRLDM